jgi:hypothetical protein
MTKVGQQSWAGLSATVCASFIIGSAIGAVLLAGPSAESQSMMQPTLPPNTPVPTTIPSLSTPIPVSPSERLLPTPPARPTESPVEITRKVIASIPPEFKRQLAPDVIAFQTRPHRHDQTGRRQEGARRVVIYHLPTGSAVILDANGNEIYRRARDSQERPVVGTSPGLQVVEGVLSNAALKARALELAR